MKLYLQRKRFDVDFCYPLVPAEDSTGFPLKARFRFQNPEVLLPQLVPKCLSAHHRFEAQKTPPNTSLSFSTRIFRENLLKPVPTGELFCPGTKPEPDFSSTTSGFLSATKTSSRDPLFDCSLGLNRSSQRTGFIRRIYYLTPNSLIYSSVQLIGNHKLFSSLCTFIFPLLDRGFLVLDDPASPHETPPPKKIYHKNKS